MQRATLDAEGKTPLKSKKTSGVQTGNQISKKNQSRDIRHKELRYNGRYNDKDFQKKRSKQQFHGSELRMNSTKHFWIILTIIYPDLFGEPFLKMNKMQSALKRLGFCFTCVK